MKYTYSDEEDEGYSDATTSRRSTRNTGTHTPAEGLAPTVTLSGRQVKARQGGAYGESALSGTHTPAVALGGYDGPSDEPEHPEHEEDGGGRPRRAAAANAGGKGSGVSKGGAHIEGYNSVDEMNDSDEDDASEQDYGDDEEEDDHVSLESDKDEDDLTDEEDELDDGLEMKQSLVVKLQVKTPTPERKTMINLRVSPEKDLAKPVNSQPAVTGDQGNGASSSAGSEGVLSKDSARASTSTSEPPQAPASSSVAVPTTSPPKSPSNAIQATPLSPLAFRGSPDKPPHAFPLPSIKLGYGGS